MALSLYRGIKAPVLYPDWSAITLQTELQAYWALDDSLADSHDDGLDLTLGAGNTEYSTGKLGDGSLRTASDRHEAPDALYPSGDYHITGWFQLLLFAADSTIAAIWPLSDGSNQAYKILVPLADGTLHHQVSSDGSTVDVDLEVESPSLNLSTWYFFDCWFDSSAQEVGARINNGTKYTADLGASQIYQDSTMPVSFGSPGDSTSANLNGLLDEIGFWHRVLTDDEISNIYNSGSGLAYPFT